MKKNERQALYRVLSAFEELWRKNFWTLTNVALLNSPKAKAAYEAAKEYIEIYDKAKASLTACSEEISNGNK